MPVPAAAPFRISRGTFDKTDSFRAKKDCFHAPSQTKTRGPLARGVPNSIAKNEQESGRDSRRDSRRGLPLLLSEIGLDAFLFQHQKQGGDDQDGFERPA